MILKVRRGGSIICPKGKIYKAGSAIPQGVLTAEQVREHIRSGYLEVVRSTKDVIPSIDEVVAAGYSRSHAEKIVEEVAERYGEKPVEHPPGVEPDLGITDEGKPVVHPRWSFDPDGLRGHDLDTLNVMILERDGDVDPFESVEEAVAWLSQDYSPPTEA